MNSKTRKGILAGAVLDKLDKYYPNIDPEVIDEIKPSRLTRRQEDKKRDDKRRQRNERDN
jgi:hypothetical protein